MILDWLFWNKANHCDNIVSNIYLGMGIWTIFQILAWIVICLLTQIVIDFFKKFNKEPHLIVMAIFAFVMGYVFGFIVSMEKLVVGGPSLFIVYYLAGLFFDTLHAVGNFFFYLICAHMRIFAKEQKNAFKNESIEKYCIFNDVVVS